LQHM